MCTAPARCSSPRLQGGRCYLEGTLLTLIQCCDVCVVFVCWLELEFVPLSVVLGTLVPCACFPLLPIILFAICALVDCNSCNRRSIQAGMSVGNPSSSITADAAHVALTCMCFINRLSVLPGILYLMHPDMRRVFASRSFASGSQVWVDYFTGFSCIARSNPCSCEVHWWMGSTRFHVILLSVLILALRHAFAIFLLRTVLEASGRIASASVAWRKTRNSSKRACKLFWWRR
jgi:hypothetical protein